MRDKRPSYQWYPKDFMTDQNVAVMSLEEQGAYRLLMDYEWLHTGLPNDTKALASMCRIPETHFKELWQNIEKCFKPSRDGTRLHHPRLQSERKKQNKWRKKSKAGGLRSAQVREELKGGVDLVQPKANTSSSTTTSSSTSKETTTTSDDGFDEFWEAYPKRAGGNPRKPAFTRWRSAVKRDEVANIIAGTERYAAYCKATKKTGTEYVMQATTFLGESEGWTETWAVTEADRVNTEAEDPGVAFNRDWAAHTTPEDDSEPVRVGGLVENLLRHVQQEGTA